MEKIQTMNRNNLTPTIISTAVATAAAGFVFVLNDSSSSEDLAGVLELPIDPSTQMWANTGENATLEIPTEPISERDFNMLLENYSISGTKSVCTYLEQNQELGEILSQIPGQINRYFVNPKLGLTLHHSHELIEYSLSIFVESEGSVDSKIESLANFDKNWWLKNDMDLIGKISIDIV